MSSEEESIDSIENEETIAIRANKRAKTRNVGGHSHDPARSSPDCYIAHLDEAVQSHISGFMGIYQWGVLTQCSRQLMSWPKPPPPFNDYDIISFYFTDHSSDGWYGVSKTVPAALEAYLDFRNREGVLGNGLREGAERTGYVQISIQFLQLGTALSGHPKVPLLQYDKSQYRHNFAPARLHPDSDKYGVKTAGGDLPTDVTRKMVNFTLYFDLGNPKINVREHCKAAWLWLEDAKPSRNMNLEHLWCSEYDAFLGQGEGVHDIGVYDIVLVKDQVSSHFTVGDRGDWAVSHKTATLWDDHGMTRDLLGTDLSWDDIRAMLQE